MDSDTSGDFVQRVLKASDRLTSRPVSQMSSYSSSDLPGRQRSTSRDRVGRLGVRVMQESGALAQKLRCASESRSSRLRQEFLERMSVPQEHGIRITQRNVISETTQETTALEGGLQSEGVGGLPPPVTETDFPSENSYADGLRMGILKKRVIEKGSLMTARVAEIKRDKSKQLKQISSERSSQIRSFSKDRIEKFLSSNHGNDSESLDVRIDMESENDPIVMEETTRVDEEKVPIDTDPSSQQTTKDEVKERRSRMSVSLVRIRRDKAHQLRSRSKEKASHLRALSKDRLERMRSESRERVKQVWPQT